MGHPGSHSKTSRSRKLKKKKISQAWKHVPVEVPAIQEAKMGGSLEPSRVRLQ